MSQVLQRLGVTKTRTTPYRPQSDGLVERFNRTLADGLAKVLQKDQDWDLLLPVLCYYFRASVHRTTQQTPAMMMIGRELRLPVDILFPSAADRPYASNDDYLVALERRLKVAYEFARQHLKLDFERREGHCHHNRKLKPLDLNRPVYVFRPSIVRGRTPKLSRVWAGPYPILEQKTDLLYRVQVGGRMKEQIVHRSNLFQPQAVEEAGAPARQ